MQEDRPAGIEFGGMGFASAMEVTAKALGRPARCVISMKWIQHCEVGYMNSSDMRQAESVRELAQLEYLLLGDLHQILSEPVSSHTRPNLVSVLDLLFTMLPSRFDLEEANGHLADVLDQFPNWHDQVEMLRIEHALLYEELRDLRQAVDAEERYEPVSEDVIRRIRTWMDRLRNHEREERRLTLLAHPPIVAAE